MVDDCCSIASGREPLGIYTETLARLYWRQGFLDKALDIYRHLVRTQPTNHRLRDQVAVLEQQLAATISGEVHEKMRDERVIAHLERWLHYLRQQRTTPGKR